MYEFQLALWLTMTMTFDLHVEQSSVQAVVVLIVSRLFLISYTVKINQVVILY